MTSNQLYPKGKNGFLKTIRKEQNGTEQNRIESFQLEGAHKNHLVQLPIA